MKKTYLLLLASALLLAALWLHFACFSTQLSPAIPSGASEENGPLRRAWDLKRLADPATGKIPEGMVWLEQAFGASLPQVISDRGNTGVWASRGPYNVGGRTRALAMDVTNENHLLAGGVSGGIWESSDGGQSWARRTPINAHPGVVSIAQDTRPGKTNTWYYISGELYGTSASGGGGAFYLGDGMFKSTDNGTTWAPIGSTDNGSPNSFTDIWQGGWRVIVDPTAPIDQDIIYAATYGAVFRSTNGGGSWTAVLGGNTPWSYYSDIISTSTGVLYAYLSSDGGQKGIWRSTNGTTWAKITPAQDFPAQYNRFVIGINPDNENEIWFVGATPGSGHYNNYIDSDDWTSLWKYTYISGDGTGAGGVWENRSMNLPSTGTEFDQFACQGGYDLVVKVQPGTGTVFLGGTNIYRSTDGFATPDNTTHIAGYKPGTYLPFFELYPNHHPDQHDMLFLPSNNKVLITASDGGLHRTEDCTAPSVSWNYLNNGYQTSQFYTAIMDKHTAGDSTLIGGLQDNGNFFVNSTNPSAPWKQTVNGDGAFGAIPAGKPFYVLSIQQGRLAKCAIDNAGNVTAFRRFDPIGALKSDYQFINPLILDPADENVLYLPAGKRLFRQDNLAAIELTGVWDSIAQGWTQFPDTLVGAADARFSAIGVSTTNPAHRVYLGADNGKLYRVDNAHTGTPSMTALTLPTTNVAAYVTCIAVDPNNGNRAILAYSNYALYSIYLTEDAGVTWKKVGGNLESNTAGTGTGPSVRWVSILPFDNGTYKYFCGTSIGLYSADTLKLHAAGQSGTQWALEAPDLIGTSVVNYIDVRPSDGLVVAATHGIGLFSANYAPVSGSNEPKPGISVQISPNPTAGAVNFRWGIEQAVTMQLYDLKGTLVRTEQWRGASGHTDLSGLPKGTYLYRVAGKGWQKSGKVVRN